MGVVVADAAVAVAVARPGRCSASVCEGGGWMRWETVSGTKPRGRDHSTIDSSVVIDVREVSSSCRHGNGVCRGVGLGNQEVGWGARWSRRMAARR